jgi:hypothetical protein
MPNMRMPTETVIALNIDKVGTGVCPGELNFVITP